MMTDPHQEEPGQPPVRMDWGISVEHDGQPKEKFEENWMDRT